jgi:hypothetical protein
MKKVTKNIKTLYLYCNYSHAFAFRKGSWKLTLAKSEGLLH